MFPQKVWIIQDGRAFNCLRGAEERFEASSRGNLRPLAQGLSPGPNLTMVGTSPLLEWGRRTSPLQRTNGDGSRWRLSQGGATCRRTAAVSAWTGQGSYEGAVAMRALVLNRGRRRCAPMLNASLASSRRPCSVQAAAAAQLGRSSCSGATWKVAPLGMRHLWCPHYTVIQLRFKTCQNWNFDFSGKTFTYDFKKNK